MTTRRLKLTLEYDGTAFAGFQKQTNAVAVQNVLEEKLAVILKHPVRVEGAGRTDSGVHAKGQVIAFDTDSDKDLAKLQYGLNGLLPQTVRARDIREMPAVFDPRRDAVSKEYRYTWWAHPVASPFWRRYTWHAYEGLGVAAMRQGAAFLVGEHDFSAFRAVGCSAKTPVRRILSVEIHEEKERVQLRIIGQAFLHQMVRIIAGTLYDVGTGKLEPGRVGEILESKDRKRAGKTAPAEGLTLWEVRYGEIPRPVRKLKKGQD